MTAPKNAILPGQNWGLCPSPVQKLSQNCRPTSSNFGCFESRIFTKFLVSQDSFFQFFHLCSKFFLEVIFSVFTTFSSASHPTCPTFARRSVPDVPDVCLTSPDVCLTSARHLPDVCLLAKKSKRLAQPFFAKFGHLQEMEVFFFEKTTSQKDVKISISKHQKNEERQKQGLA